jgi:hypothetical protein
MKRKNEIKLGDIVQLNLTNKITVGTNELEKLKNLIGEKNSELSRVNRALRDDASRLIDVQGELHRAEDALSKARSEMPDALRLWISENLEKLETAKIQLTRETEKLENRKVVVSADLEILADERREIDFARAIITQQKVAADKREAELSRRENTVEVKAKGFHLREEEIVRRESDSSKKDESIKRQATTNDTLSQRIENAQKLLAREKLQLQERTLDLDKKIVAFEQMTKQAPDYQRRIARLEAEKYELENRRVDNLQTIAALSRQLPSVEIAGIAFSETVLHQLVNNSSLCFSILGQDVVTVGEGPIPGDKFDQFLHSCGITVHDVGYNSGVIISGRMQWESRHLDKQLAVRQNDSVRIYSQEMILFAMAMGGDPFDLCNYFELFELGAGHPALTYLMKSGFNWPSPVFHGGRCGVIEGSDWMAEGLLKHLGYTVGITRGLPEPERHRILDRAMAANLNLDGQNRFGSDWGNAGEKNRLHKLAQSIAKFIVLHRGRENADSYETAIEQWESDLAWLRERYYRDWMKFRWPQTHV